MREIKFRAWDEDGYMFYPTRIEFQECGAICVWRGLIFGTLGSAVIDLMQFTGLKDKNGKDIYEGDIVKLSNDYWETSQTTKVKSWGDIVADFGDFDYWNVRFAQDADWEFEVIGNIYENPELIK